MSKPERNMSIKKIHVARRQLALDEDCYRALLNRVTGKSSCSDMTDGQLGLVLDEFKRLGWKGVHRPKKSGERKMAKDPQAKKIRAMWLQLRDMGVIQNSSEEALTAYVKRITGVEDLQWLHESDANKVINSLRSWIRRVGGDEHR